ncbi:MAG: hypothetical protein ACRENG_12300, partial [bacterium]
MRNLRWKFLSDGLTISSVVLCLLLMQPMAVTAQICLDQSFGSERETAGGIGSFNNQYLFQTFTAGTTGTLAGVNIDVQTQQSNFPLEITIRETSGGTPTETILGSTTLALGESAPLSKLITFPQTISVVSGTQYAIAVRYVNAPADGTAEGRWFGALTVNSTYAGGNFGAFHVGSGWFHVNDDFNFRTYIVGDLQADAGPDQAFCSGGSATIGGNPTASGGSGSYTYSWSPSAGLDANNVANPIASPAVTTTYTVTITEGNCTATDQVTVTVNQPPSLFFDAAGPFFLSDPAFDLANVVGPSGGSFSGPGVSGTMFDPAVAGVGTHTIIYSYTDGNSCSNSASQNVTVNENPVPEMDVQGNSVSIADGDVTSSTADHTNFGSADIT